MKGRLLAVLLTLFAYQAHALEFTEADYCISSDVPGKLLPLKLQVAETPEQRTQGLMNRTSIKPYDGMLFQFPKPAPAKMWMKDTLVSLDMLFVDTEGKVVHIAPKTKPGSEAVIASPAPVLYVIELEGGRAEQEQISERSRLWRGACGAFGMAH